MPDLVYVDLLAAEPPLEQRPRAAVAHFGRHLIDAGEGPPWEVDHPIVAFDPDALTAVEHQLAAGPGHRLYRGPSVMVDGAGVHTPVEELYWSETVALRMEPLKASIARVEFAASQWGAVYQGLRLGQPAPARTP